MRPEAKKKRVPRAELVERIQPEHLAPESLGLVVFGPGQGESVIVLLPDGRVGIVDGCREPTRGETTGLGDPVREFLNALEVVRGGPLELCFVCLTHPHEDHYRGLGRLLEAYRGRVQQVWEVMEVGDRHAEALSKYVRCSRAGRAPVPDDADLGSLERVIAGITDAVKHGARFMFLLAGMKLLKEQVARCELSIYGCGPAHADARHAQHALVAGLEALSEADADGRRTVRFDPNAASGALLIRWGQAGVLLGGDLLCEQGPYRGWNLVAPDIEGPVQVVKVAHHASCEAHHAELWARLRAPLALVTPFKNAVGEQPPRPEQIAQLARDAVVVITSEPQWPESRDNPRPLYKPAKKPASHGKVLPLARNPVLAPKPKVAEDDTRNAVAVSLGPDGRVLRLVLAGKANVYEPS